MVVGAITGADTLIRFIGTLRLRYYCGKDMMTLTLAFLIYFVIIVVVAREVGR